MLREQKEVISLIKEYGNSNPFELCDLLNIKLEYSYLRSLRGFYRYSKRNHFIEINSRLNIEEKYATCAHELGHYMMHQGLNGIFLSTTLMLPNKYEVQADKFALYLLIEHYGCYDNIPTRLLKYLRS